MKSATFFAFLLTLRYNINPFITIAKEINMDLKFKNILSVCDLNSKEIKSILEKSIELKKEPFGEKLYGQTLAQIFEKPSLRTRVSFELAILEQAGFCIVLRPDEIQMGSREPTKDIAAYLSRNITIAALRVFKHSTLEEFARYATIPVINALSDLEHPCQAIADILTILEHKEKLSGLKLTYLGDGNNVCHSLMLAAAMTGLSVTVACPKGYEPLIEYTNKAVSLGKMTGSEITISNNPDEAVSGADVLYTDVWTSMGQESEKQERLKIFSNFQLNEKRLAATNEAIVMHCLPAHRGEEITAEVINSSQSVIFDQAENRRHAQKAMIMHALNIL